MRTIILFSFLSMYLMGTSQIYVKRYATGTNNGTSWTNAYTDLKTALNAAATGSTLYLSGDTFYLPAASARSANFLINNKSLTIYGGFPTTGNPTLANRNINLYPTILSGDISKNDPQFTSASRKSDASRSDNAYNVMSIELSGATAYTVVLNGLTIQDGSNEQAGGAGTGLHIKRNANGGATHTINIQNCTFRYNTASYGAAIHYYLYYTNNGDMRINVWNNKFYSNIGDEFPVMGGSIAGTAGLTVLSVKFESNVVYKNIATTAGAAIYAAICHNNYNSSSSLVHTLQFNTFANNTANGGVVCCEGTAPMPSANLSRLWASNNIFNSNNGAKAFYRRPGGKDFYLEPVVDYNIIPINDSFNILYGGAQNQIRNVQFVDASNDNYRLADCEPAINNGNTLVFSKDGTSSYNLSLYGNDADGNPRTINPSIDRGAYEYLGSSLPSYYNFTKSVCSNDSIFFNGAYRKVAGNYKDTLVNSKSCDSFITMTLSIYLPNTSFTQKICMNDSFLFNGVYRKVQGNYTDTFPSYLGCDSIVTCSLTVFTFTPPTIGVQAPNLNTLVAVGGPYDGYGWYKNDTALASGATLFSYNFNFIPGEYKLYVIKVFPGKVCTTASNVYSYGLTYTINASAGVNGTISPSGIIQVNSNSSQTFTITPNTGFVMDSLIVDNMAITPATTHTFSNMNASHSIRAVFKSATNPTNAVQNIQQLMRIFPNPAQDILHLQSMGEKPTKVELFNLSGVQVPVDRIDGETLNVSNLDKGLYWLKIWMANAVEVLHFVKE